MQAELLTPQIDHVPKTEKRARRFSREKIQSALDEENLMKRLEGQPPTKEALEESFKPEELKRVLEAMKLTNTAENNYEGAQKFAAFEDTADSIVESTKEPVAIFGSLAMFKKEYRANKKIPDDIDIATTPKGAEDLYKALNKRDDVVITEKLYVHDPGGPLAALRFAGYIIKENSSHPFEIFGEGGECEEGEFKGEQLQGLFQLGDPENHDPEGLIDGNSFTSRALKAAYERLSQSGLDSKDRTNKIKLLGKEIRHNRDRLKLSKVREKLSI